MTPRRDTQTDGGCRRKRVQQRFGCPADWFAAARGRFMRGAVSAADCATGGIGHPHRSLAEFVIQAALPCGHLKVAWTLAGKCLASFRLSERPARGCRTRTARHTALPHLPARLGYRRAAPLRAPGLLGSGAFRRSRRALPCLAVRPRCPAPCRAATGSRAAWLELVQTRRAAPCRPTRCHAPAPARLAARTAPIPHPLRRGAFRRSLRGSRAACRLRRHAPTTKAPPVR